jgi:hypothetical protein
MSHPKGFVVKGQEKKLCKLIKSLYGMKQEPRAWYEKNIVTDLMRTVTSKRELWPKKPIFLHKKHQNQPPNQKVVLPVAPFF